MKYRFLIIAPMVLILDQVTKWLVLLSIPRGVTISVIPGFFDLVHVRNTGAAFGMLSGIEEPFRTLFFCGIAAVAVVVLILFFRNVKPNEKLMPLAIALIFGGIAGNILDRIRFGEVIDFVSWHIGDRVFMGVPLHWPAFNIADSAISISMVLLVVSGFLQRKNHRLKES